MRTIERTSQLTTCGETHAAQFSRWGLERRSIPPEPPPHRENWRFAALCVAFRSKYTRASSPGGGSSLTRLVSRAPHRSRRSPGFHHRLLTTCGETHAAQFSRWGLLPHAPCQPGASPASALTRVPPPAVRARLPAGIQGGRHRAALDASVAPLVEALANDQPLEPRCHDHALSGEWADHRDCHVRPDLVLIYQKPDAETLRLVRLGSHSELGF